MYCSGSQVYLPIFFAFTHISFNRPLDLEVFMKLVECPQLFRILLLLLSSSPAAQRGPQLWAMAFSSTTFSCIALPSPPCSHPSQPHSSTSTSKQDKPPTTMRLFLLQVRFLQRRKVWIRLSPSDAGHFQVYQDGDNSPSFLEFSSSTNEVKQRGLWGFFLGKKWSPLCFVEWGEKQKKKKQFIFVCKQPQRHLVVCEATLSAVWVQRMEKTNRRKTSSFFLSLVLQ